MKTIQKLNETKEEPEKEDINKQNVKKFDYGIKRYGTKKPDLEKLNLLKGSEDVRRPLSLRIYMKRKWTKVRIIILVYSMIIGAMLTTPIIIGHFGAISKNQKEKERFKFRLIHKKKNSRIRK